MENVYHELKVPTRSVAMDKDYFGMGSLMGGMGIGSAMSPWQNPANSAQGYLSQIPGTISPYYNPYINAGRDALGQLQGQYGNLMNDPGGMMNKMGQGFQKSPGFDFALQQALQGANHAAAAGGMAGSPMAQQQNMQLATNMGNQEYNNWMDRTLGLYGKGLEGMGGINQMGYNASNELANSLGQNLMNQAQFAYQGQQAQNQKSGTDWGDIFGGGASALASFFM